MSSYTSYFRDYYQMNKERIMKNTMEYYANNKERLLEYRREYSKQYYQNVLKAKRCKPRTVKPKIVKHKTITLETNTSVPMINMQETVLYPTQIVKGNFTLCFD